MSSHNVPGPSDSMASAQPSMFSAAGRGLQASYSSRMSAQQPHQQQTGGYNAGQLRVEVIAPCCFNLH